MTVPDPVHGRLRHSGEIEDAAEAALRKWIRYFLRVVCQQHGHGPIAEPKQFAIVNEYETFPTQQLPAIIISASKTVGEPERSGDGYYKGTFDLQVAVVVASATPREVRRIGDLYGLAIATSLLQKPAIGDEIEVCDWLGVESLPVSTQKARAVHAVEHSFEVEMRDIVSDLMGPVTDEVPNEIPEDLPEVDEVDIQVSPSDD